MKRMLAVACAAGCSSGGGGSAGTSGSDAAGSGSGVTFSQFSLSGSVSDSLATLTNVRVVVGVARPSDLPQAIYCERLLVHDDHMAPALPTSYSLSQLPYGNLTLVALVLPSQTSKAPYAAYPLTVDNEGVHYLSPMTTTKVDLSIQGTAPYECP